MSEPPLPLVWSSSSSTPPPEVCPELPLALEVPPLPPVPDQPSEPMEVFAPVDGACVPPIPPPPLIPSWAPELPPNASVRGSVLPVNDPELPVVLSFRDVEVPPLPADEVPPYPPD